MKVLKGIDGIRESYTDMIKNNEFKNDKHMPADCIACGKCEKLCTQHLDIINRLRWLDENIINA